MAHALPAEAGDASRRSLEEHFESKLRELATRCVELGILEQARITREWVLERDLRRQYCFPCLAPSPPTLGAETSDDILTWHERFLQLRKEHAEQLFRLIQQGLAQGETYRAYRLVGEVLRQNPLHAGARRLLGHHSINGNWHTPFAAAMLADNHVEHPQFGWLPVSHVPRYEAGERFYHNRWMPAEKEQRIRAQMSRGWRVETDHYLVQTNHSLEAAVGLGRQLENLYAVWQQLFLNFHTSQDILKRRLQGDRGTGKPRLKRRWASI